MNLEYFNANKGGGGGSSIYDKVIRTQAEFDTLIASPTWLDAKSVCFIGDGGTLEFTSSGSITIPVNVKNIKGLNSAKIGGNGSFGYAELPTSNDYSISDLSVIIFSEDWGTGFLNCTNLVNCYANVYGSSSGIGFYNCTNLVNCEGTGEGDPTGEGFTYCKNLVNCNGQNSYFIGFNSCSYLSNCKGTTGGTMTHVDSETVEGEYVGSGGVGVE